MAKNGMGSIFRGEYVGLGVEKGMRSINEKSYRGQNVSDNLVKEKGSQLSG
jgi:hypothetical protein